MAVLKRVIEDTPRPIREINPEIPDWLCDIIAKLHAKKPEDRFQTAKEVAELLGERLADVQAGRAIKRASRVSGGSEPRNLPPAHAGGSPRRGSPRRQSFGILKMLVGLSIIAILVTLIFASPFLYRYATNQSTLILSGTMDPNLDKVLVKQQGETVVEFSISNSIIHLSAGDYELEVICKAGHELAKFRVGSSSSSGSAGWHQATGPSFLVRLARGDHVSINLELEKKRDRPPEGRAPPFAVAPFDAAKAKEHQDAWAKHLGVPVEHTNSIGMKFRAHSTG